MAYFTCNACHHVFQNEVTPEECPFCHNNALFARNGSGRHFKVPSLRPASDIEIEQSKLADKEEARFQSFKERFESLKDYTLSDDEYHLALMLLFYLKNSPDEYVIMHLNDLLSPRNSFMDDKVAATKTYDLYAQAQKHFSSALADERRKTGYNDAIQVATFSGPESAAYLLAHFRQDEADQIVGKTQNLSNIRNVRFDQPVNEPGDDYIRFLMNWHNSIA